MTVADLRGILSHLQNLYVAGGAKGPAKDLQIIADLLRPHAGARLDLFIEDLSARLRQGKAKPPARKKSAAPPGAALNEASIAAHVAQLRNAGTQQSGFEEALERLKADPSLKLADVTEIARQYSNSVTKYRSLAAAQKGISQAFVRRARFENKLQS
jgi:hypothetical protein